MCIRDEYEKILEMNFWSTYDLETGALLMRERNFSAKAIMVTKETAAILGFLLEVA